MNRKKIVRNERKAHFKLIKGEITIQFLVGSKKYICHDYDDKNVYLLTFWEALVSH